MAIEIAPHGLIASHIPNLRETQARISVVIAGSRLNIQIATGSPITVAARNQATLAHSKLSHHPIYTK